MGKDLKGRELGKGIIQRKDGRYSARFRSRNGNRIEKYFSKPSEAKQWLLDARYEDAHGKIAAVSSMTVDSWYAFWFEHIKQKTVKPSTLKSYKYHYESNIKEHIGNMRITDIKPMHCQNILNSMVNDGYAEASIKEVRIVLKSMFDCAVDNDIIMVTPVKRTVKCPIKEDRKDRRVLTIDEQNLFLESAKGTDSYTVYVFALQTGLRAGEIIGLRWQDIDFHNRLIHIRQTMDYNNDVKKFIAGTPKSNAGIRDVPMTQIVYDLLKCLEQGKKDRKIINIEYQDLVFINRKGRITRNSTYDAQIKKIAEENSLEKFSMHTLRHTFATRCIEAGMNPKTLQKILGHSSIKITMDLYVHVTEQQKILEMQKFEEKFKNCVEMVSNR